MDIYEFDHISNVDVTEFTTFLGSLCSLPAQMESLLGYSDDQRRVAFVTLNPFSWLNLVMYVGELDFMSEDIQATMRCRLTR